MTIQDKTRNLPGFPPLPCLSLAVPAEDGELHRRAYPESPHPYRTSFVRDCGRILHAKAFRRLAGKTQVFTRGAAGSIAESDHSRSRLTHTLEVAQIARTLAASLGLNAPLSEALALVHDIGHPPFGHAGEAALDRALRAHGLSFDHNLHALRIVTGFELRYPAFPGLNLTLGVREGIVKHSRDYSAATHPELSEYFLDRFPPLEAQLIDLADEIAYLAADLEDGLAAGILELPMVLDQAPVVGKLYSQVQAEYPAAEPTLLIQEALKRLLNNLVTDLMQEVVQQVQTLGIESLAQLRAAPKRIAQLSPPMEAERQQTKRFLYENLYQSPALDAEHQLAEEVVRDLFELWTRNPGLLPPDHQARAHTEGVPRAVADYIAGMTDSYIEQAWLQSKQR